MPNRGRGRTTRMLVMALEATVDHERVHIFVPQLRDAETMRNAAHLLLPRVKGTSPESIKRLRFLTGQEPNDRGRSPSDPCFADHTWHESVEWVDRTRKALRPWEVKSAWPTEDLTA